MEDFSFLNHIPVIHDRYPVTDLLDHRHLMCNHHNGNAKCLIKLLQQL